MATKKKVKTVEEILEEISSKLDTLEMRVSKLENEEVEEEKDEEVEEEKEEEVEEKVEEEKEEEVEEKEEEEKEKEVEEKEFKVFKKKYKKLAMLGYPLAALLAVAFLEGNND